MLRLIFAGAAAFIGLKATKSLLRGTKTLPHTNKMYRDFEKLGNYQQALQDFYSVNPTSIRNINTRNGVSYCKLKTESNSTNFVTEYFYFCLDLINMKPFNGQLRTQAFFMRTAKTLIRLGGCPGWSESSLGAQSFCWFCHVAAHFVKKWQ